MNFTHVDKPIRIRNLEIKNRIVRSAHGTGFATEKVTDRFIAYHEARARGGVGLSILELLSVHPTSVQLLPGWDPTIGDGVRKLVDTIRPYGMRLFWQLWHGGHCGLPFGTPLWSASDIANPVIGVVPIPMTKTMIDEIVTSYAETARRCEEWGLDGVEIHCAHDYLPGQFLSPVLNKREDDYGGSFENRARFGIEVTAAVRAAVSNDFVVGVRVSPDFLTKSLPPEDVLKFVQMLEARGLVDFVDISAGSYYVFDKIAGAMHEPVGYELPTSTPISRQVKSVTMVTGRFRTLDDADQVIRAGDADMVSMTRATIADPDLVKKSLGGEGTRVRPCIGCNQGCFAGIMTTHVMSCVVNPAVGFERTIGDDHLVPAAAYKKILVIGGGVSGMEAARVAALRGHEVVLAEAGNDLGGTLRIAAKAPMRHAIQDIALWQEREIYRLGVKVRLSTFMELDDILAEAPDAVIIATGAVPRMDGIQILHPYEPISGIDRPNVISSHDLFTGNHQDLGNTAVVIDDVGHYEAIGAAEELINRGLSVTFVTYQAAFGHLVQWALVVDPALRRLSKGTFNLMTRSRAIAIEDAFVVLGPCDLLIDDAKQRVPADTVVFVSHNRPDYSLYNQLTERGMYVRLVGDAQSPRFLDAAIREGYMAGAEV